jgi:hypothetical protein
VLHQPASVAWFQNLSAAEQEGIRLAPESDQNAQNNVWKLVQQVHAEWNGKFLAGQVLIESANRRAVAVKILSDVWLARSRKSVCRLMPGVRGIGKVSTHAARLSCLLAMCRYAMWLMIMP